jgi:hypothetical protein
MFPAPIVAIALVTTQRFFTGLAWVSSGRSRGSVVFASLELQRS